MTPQERVLSWRAEIAVELGEATKAVPPLEEIHATAVVAAQAALDDFGAVQRLIGPAVPRPETPIILRSQAHLMEVDLAKSRRARALANLQASRAAVTTLQRALAQIDRIVPPAEEA
jgi:hypothetical protein